MNRNHDVEKQWYWRRTIGDAARSGQPNSHPLRRFVQEIDSRGAGWISNSRRQFLGALLVHYNLQMRPSQCN